MEPTVFIPPPAPSPPPRRTQGARPQSFLLLGERTNLNPLSYLRSSPRRERRQSIQSLPLPSQSRRSSFQYHPSSWDKYDRSWALEEEDTPSPMWIEDVQETRDPAATIDWRQFHNDLLRED